MTEKEAWALYSELSTDGVWVPALVMRACGGDGTMSVLLQQIVYWHRKMGGEFYKRHFDWEEETGLSERQVRHVVKKLETRGFISTRIGHGLDRKVAPFYTVHPTAILESIRQTVANRNAA